ncbi:MAG: hypothetical protein LUF02_05905 [Erysipelotrichaceae bacterium]|nr:hypothetical protein [Erysipelotrichaceae bacterium]
MRQKVKYRKRKIHLKSHILTSQDALFKEYFRDEGHLSDFVNGTLFHGIKKLSSTDVLLNQNTDMSTAIPNGDLYLSLNRYRDVLATCFANNSSFLLGIENESSVKGDEVLRIWLYDWCKYFIDYQNKKIMNPIITIVLCTSSSCWTKPKSLFELIDIPDDFKNIVNNFKIKVYNLYDLDKNLFHNNDNQDLIRLTQLLKNRGTDISDDSFDGVSDDVAILVGTITGMKEIVTLCLQKMKNGGKCNMLESIKQSNLKFKNEGKIEGKIEGRIEGKAETIIKLLPTYIECERSASIIEIIGQSTGGKLDQLTAELVSGKIKNETDIKCLIQDKKEYIG